MTTVPGIRVDSASKRFGDLEALAPVELSIGAGEIVTLIGPSGCGKTTLLRMIAGLERPTGGSITIDGSTPDAARKAKRIGFIPQSPALLPWRTVEANARLLLDLNSSANPASPPDPIELLERVGLGEFRQAYPHELSGGMQQRVGLVRAFALGARYLLMDEPFAALDEITRFKLNNDLLHLWETFGWTVIFVTHSVFESVYLSSRIVVMAARPGRVFDELSIDAPYPREEEFRTSATYNDYCRKTSDALHAAMEGSGHQ